MSIFDTLFGWWDEEEKSDSCPFCGYPLDSCICYEEEEQYE